MASVTRGTATGETQIEVNWLDLTTYIEIGGAPILSYNL
jgi:hypothetical protein